MYACIEYAHAMLCYLLHLWRMPVRCIGGLTRCRYLGFYHMR